jgi:hypothetical protein
MRSTFAIIALATTMGLSGCASMSDSERHVLGGAAIGAAGGAAVGALTGGSVGTGALIGGALGAGGGYLYDRDQRGR